MRPALSAEAARDAAVPPTFCHVMVHAIAADAPNIAAEAVGAFPLYGPGRRVVGYRPTQDACLMRDMRRRELCPICREALWENLLLSKGARAARISLLHSIRLRSASVDGGGDELVEIEAATAPLGALRPPEDDAALALAEIVELTVAPRRGGGELALRPARAAHVRGERAPRAAARLPLLARRGDAADAARPQLWSAQRALLLRGGPRRSLGEPLRAPLWGASACGASRATERRWRGRARPAETWSRRPPIAPSIYV